jgi:hypothetical protein
LISKEDYFQAVSAFYKEDLGSNDKHKPSADDLEQFKKAMELSFKKSSRHLKRIENAQSDIHLEEEDDLEIRKSIAPLFYINEKKRVFKYFDF